MGGLSTCVLTQTFHSPCRMVLYWIERSGTKVSPPLPARYSPSHPVLLRQIRLSFRHKHSVFVSGGPYGFLSVPLQLRRFAATRPAAPGGLPCSSAFQLEQECLSPCRKGCRGFQMLPPCPVLCLRHSSHRPPMVPSLLHGSLVSTNDSLCALLPPSPWSEGTPHFSVTVVCARLYAFHPAVPLVLGVCFSILLLFTRFSFCFFFSCQKRTPSWWGGWEAVDPHRGAPSRQRTQVCGQDPRPPGPHLRRVSPLVAYPWRRF